jgi:toxin CptA
MACRAGAVVGVERSGKLQRTRARRLAAHVWTPHAATAVIGVTFVVILLLVGVWAYTDVLAQLARGSSMRLALGVACLVALYAGALLGGWTAGRWKSTRLSASGVLRCFAGGAMMAWGSLLIPGSNDGLILVGMPLLRPYAWLAFATMCVAIAAAMLLARRVAASSGAEALP